MAEDTSQENMMHNAEHALNPASQGGRIDKKKIDLVSEVGGEAYTARPWGGEV